MHLSEIMKYLLGPILAVTFSLGNDQVRYDHYHLMQITPNTEKELEFLHELQYTRDSYIFWNHVSSLNSPVNIVVPPNLRSDFQEIALRKNLTAKLITENIQTLIDEERNVNRDPSKTFNWRTYQTLEMINHWFGTLEKEYPDKVKIIKGGDTYEGRKILGIKISFKSGNKGAFLEGGIHAQEWISPTIVTYIANELLISNDAAVRKVAESRDWYIFPVINPDGYVYSHTADRFWRKNRKPYSLYIGVDLDRNWDYQWNNDGEKITPSTGYSRGPSAFSEIETKSLSNFIATIGPTLDSYITFHNFNQRILIPFGHSGKEVPANNKELRTMGENAVKALAKRYGTTYAVGNYAEMSSVSSGGSLDWAMGTFRNIRIGYKFSSRGNHKGYELSSQEIIPNGEEILDSLISIFQQADG